MKSYDCTKNGLRQNYYAMLRYFLKFSEHLLRTTFNVYNQSFATLKMKIESLINDQVCIFVTRKKINAISQIQIKVKND